jgi:cob(I)alamin adenosyltransferase
MEHGFVQVYTGNGKGKTTAAIGLAVRAAGAGLKILFCQFLKSQNYSEIKALGQFNRAIEIRQFGNESFVTGVPAESDVSIAVNGFEDALTAVMSGIYDLVVLDEINVAIRLNLIMLQSVVQLMKNKPAGVELVLTGRDAAKEVIENADLVTEMKETKHYFSKGVKARQGIEM